MPRKSRIDAPGALHHIIARGIENRNIFEDDKDRNNFLVRFGEILSETSTPCYAWTLMPNHFHILLRTTVVPIATVMRRLLTGHAVFFNRRHRRHGHLFQNRYKSILCQEDTYFLELVRYIHLNPVRAGLVEDLNSLERFPFSGHRALVGKCNNEWLYAHHVLQLFDKNQSGARRRYKRFVEKGLSMGKRPDLVGGGLIRSYGGWLKIKEFRNSGSNLKGDERILGDSDFVQRVLEAANEKMARKYLLQSQGFNLDMVASRVADLMGMQPESVWAKGKHRRTVEARSLLCFWATNELAISQTYLARKLKISQPAVGLSVKRGEAIAKSKEYSLIDEGNYKVRNVP
jgi:REP element-mobilizing transposase RayT